MDEAIVVCNVGSEEDPWEFLGLATNFRASSSHSHSSFISSPCKMNIYTLVSFSETATSNLQYAFGFPLKPCDSDFQPMFYLSLTLLVNNTNTRYKAFYSPVCFDVLETIMPGVEV